VHPEITLGPLTLQTFGLMFALAFLAAGALIAKRLGEIGKPVDWAYELCFAALAGGIVGSRLYFIVQNYDSVKDDLLGKLFQTKSTTRNNSELLLRVMQRGRRACATLGLVC